MLSRRRFLYVAGGVGAAGIAGTSVWAALLRDHADDAVRQRDDAAGSDAASSTASSANAAYAKRVLVVLQMSGGNDGLNTLVPSNAAYRDARKTLAIAENSLVSIKADGYALHPSLSALAPLWDAGSVAALEGVAMKDQSRSHF